MGRPIQVHVSSHLSPETTFVVERLTTDGGRSFLTLTLRDELGDTCIKVFPRDAEQLIALRDAITDFFEEAAEQPVAA